MASSRALKQRLRQIVSRFFVLARDGAFGDDLQHLVEEGILTIGDYTYGAPMVHVFRRLDGSPFGGVVRIGSFCSIAGGVEIFTGGDHRTDWVSTYPFRRKFSLPGADEDGQPSSKGDVVIGNDVWVATGAKILSGVRVGDGAVIGAFAVVTQDVDPYAIVVGNPARTVRLRFAPSQIEVLRATRWWDWPIERILANVPLLCESDVDAFLAGID